MTFRSWILSLTAALGIAGSLSAADAPEKADRPSGRRGNPLDRFEQADRNHDGKITEDELDNPLFFQMLDLNHDGVILRAEAVEAVIDQGMRRHWASATNVPDRSDGATVVSLTEALRPVPGAALGVGKRLADLSIHPIGGRRQALAPGRGRRALVVAVTSASCPLSGKYAPVLARLERDYRDRGVDFVFVAPVATDSVASLRALAQAQGWQGPLVPDPDRVVAGALGLRSTTEVLVYDAARTLVYRGGIDDQHGLGYSRSEPRVRPLRDALDAVLSGRAPAVAATTAPGCVVEPPSAGKSPARKAIPVTYHRQISRLLQQHCLECHRPGGLAPFSLERPEDVVAHAGMIRKQVERGVMPPWFAAPSTNAAWANDRSLPDADRRELLGWIADGMPLGKAADAPLPRVFPDGWALGTPDVVYQIPKAIAIPAEGVMNYQEVSVDTGLAEDRWVAAVEIQPTARPVVHHVLVTVQLPGERKGRRAGRGEGGDERAGFFAAYVPGNACEQYPEGFGKRLPAGSVLRFQIHYTPNGVATNDQVRIALRFCPRPPEHAVHVIGLANPLLQIPPGASRHPEVAATQVPSEARILGFLPHMHLRGTAFRYEVVEPNGAARTLLDIPRYDFNWQYTYRCAEPVPIPAGSRIRATGWFDNSAGNPANPDPTRTVKWGLQTFEEMMLGYVEYYYPGDAR